MTNMANLPLAQVYPKPGWEYQLNCCGNPDCGNYGVEADFSIDAPKGRNAPQERERLARDSNAFAVGLGSYEMKGGSGKKDARTSTVFEYQTQPFDWTDDRRLRCQHVLGADVCNFGFSLLADEHLDEEISRLERQNGVLDGASCGACGRRYLAAPWEFVLNGRNEAKAGGKRKSDGARSVRVMHRPCKERPGARFTISLSHIRQRKTSDNQKILRALSNSAGIHDIHRALAGMEEGERCGMSRIYGRIFWLEGQLLAYEQEQLARWREQCEEAGKPMVHRLCHDDIVLGVNWQTDTDRNITPLNCSITADADSGYVYRMDVDFDPRVEPVALFREAYLDDQGMPKNLRWEYITAGTNFTHPRFHFQRPTGRLDEHAFFAACLNHLGVFRETKARRLAGEDKAARQIARDVIHADLTAEMDLIKTIYYGWFDLKKVERKHRASFSGVTVQQAYTKAAHFAALKKMLPKGEICLITEQEGTLTRTIPHIFRSEIDADSFTWLIVGFDKEAKKPQIEDRTKAYWKALRAHREAMMAADGDDPADEEVGLDFVRANMSTIYRVTASGQQPWPGLAFQSSAYPHVWIKSPVQSAGETEKVVGFPILKKSVRQALKQYDFDEEIDDLWLRRRIADEVLRATLQAVSTFMNSLRERLSPAARSGAGGARSGGSYVQGAMFNPRVLIAILNIFRIQYNFFEARTYVTPWNGERELRETIQSTAAVRLPGREQRVAVYKRRRHKPRRLTPAMRHGIWLAAEGDAATPNLMKVLYYPWLYARTPLWKKFTTSGVDMRRKAPTADARRRRDRRSGAGAASASPKKPRSKASRRSV